MRIIAGKHRGRRIGAPRSNAIRPTIDRVRESLFAILGDLHDAVVVDGYAGTGALGLEALSRGARRAFFFDRSRDAITLVRENLELLGESKNATVVQGAFVSSLGQLTEEVDIVFLDPPYGSGELPGALDALSASPHIRADCLVVVEQEDREEAVEHPAFEFDEARKYGNTRITLLYRRSLAP